MPDDPALHLFPDEYVPHVQGSNAYKNWAKQNTGEAQKWAKFRNAVIAGQQVAPPVLTSSFGKSLIDAGCLHMSISHFVGQVTPTYPPPPAPPPPPPPPGTGALRGHFTDFFTTWGSSSAVPNGQIFQNRWNNGPGLQTLAAVQNPWPSTSGAAIYEITDLSGRLGFRFLINPEMHSDATSKKTEIYEFQGNAFGQPMARGIGFTDEVSFVLRFPSTGNTSGFPGPNEGVFDRRNVFWQHSLDTTNHLNYFGISRLGFTNRFFNSVMRDSAASTELYAVTTTWEVLTDTDYLFREIVKWATDGTGTYNSWIKRPSDSSEIPFASYTGPTMGVGDFPNTEFGFYSASALNNEAWITDVRVTQH